MHTHGTAPIKLMLAGAPIDMVTRKMVPVFDQKRFTITNIASTWEDVQQRMQYSAPEVLVIYADLAPDPKTLGRYLASLNHVIVIVLLPTTWEKAAGVLREVGVVKDVFTPPFNYTTVADRAATKAASNRALTQGLQTGPAPQVQATEVMGTRTIAVIGKGGTGKSTVSSNLAMQLSLSGLRTLIMDLDVPGALAAYFAIPAIPNAALFFAEPQPDLKTFRGILQHKHSLDIALPPTEHDVADRLNQRPYNKPNSVHALVQTAKSDDYAAIVLDIPADPRSEFGLQSLMNANYLLMVVRPATVDIMWAVETMKLLFVEMSGQHHISRERVYLVMNRVNDREDNIRPDDFHQDGNQIMQQRNQGMLPPIITVLPDEPAVRNAQNQGELPLTFPETSDTYRRGIKALAQTLVPAADKGTPDSNGRRVLRLGPVKVKL
jgi:MinD-like ATPase involved in chromosome partitioning or flagellar assembly